MHEMYSCNSITLFVQGVNAGNGDIELIYEVLHFCNQAFYVLFIKYQVLESC